MAIRFSFRATPLVLACGVLSLGGCAHGDDLGYRAAVAARAGDLDTLDRLMAEARGRRLRGRFSVPDKTVFTHFLDLAGHPEFEARLQRWRARGWVPPEQTCAIERARHRGRRASDPGSARRAALRAVDHARAAAGDPQRRWVIQACLEGAEFLTDPGPEELEDWLAVVADPTESVELRQAMLQGMTHWFLPDPARVLQQIPTPTKAQARSRARAELTRARDRLVEVVRAAEAALDLPTLVRGTAFGGLELERASGMLGQTFLPSFAGPHARPDRVDLVDGWIAHLRAGPPIPRLEPLGLWRRPGGEPPGRRRRWYACLHEDGVRPFLQPDGSRSASELVRRCGGDPVVGPARLRFTLERMVPSPRPRLELDPS